MKNKKYTMLIQWSNEDDCFVVSLPESGEFSHTHGYSYEEAVENGQELLDFLIESAIKSQEELPIPQTFPVLSVA